YYKRHGGSLMTMHIPVTIIGAGPTGLTVALALSRYHIPFKIIDKHELPTVTSNALAVQPRTLEIWHELGLIDEALKRGNKIHAMNIYHGKSRLAQMQLNGIESPYPFILGLPQHQTEDMLIRHLHQKGIEVQRGIECINIQQNETHVEIESNNGNLSRWTS